MNNAHGLRAVLSHPNSITLITRSLHTTETSVKIIVLEILGAICLIPDGHRKVRTISPCAAT
jgi:dishevelled associated activator of morphogenesis